MPHRDIVEGGALAGGIGALQTILQVLPWDLAASLLVVVHSTRDSPGWWEILNRSSKLLAFYAVQDAPTVPARIYVARPAGAHMRLKAGKVKLRIGPRENRSRPSIDALFRSASYA